MSLEIEDFKFYHQVRLVAAYFRLGSEESAQLLIKACANAKLDKEVRIFALQALLQWAIPLDTDPVLGHYRPTLKAIFSRNQLNFFERNLLIYHQKFYHNLVYQVIIYRILNPRKKVDFL